MGSEPWVFDIAELASAVVDVVGAAPRHAMQRAELVAAMRTIGLSDEDAQMVLAFAVGRGDLVEVGEHVRAPATVLGDGPRA